MVSQVAAALAACILTQLVAEAHVLNHSSTDHVNKAGHRGHPPAGRFLQRSLQASAKSEEAAAEINAKALQAFEEADALKLECMRRREALEEKLSHTQSEVAFSSSFLAGNVADRSEVAKAIHDEDIRRGATLHEGAEVEMQCKFRIKALKKGLEALEKDVSAIEALQSLSGECSGSSSGAALIQQLCELAHPKAHARRSEQSHAQQHHHVGSHRVQLSALSQMPMLRTPAARRALQILLDMEAQRKSAQRTRHGHGGKALHAPQLVQVHEEVHLHKHGSTKKDWPGKRNAKLNVRRQNARACKRELSESADCDSLGTLLVVLRSKLRAERTQAEQAISDAESWCDEQEKQESLLLERSQHHRDTSAADMDRLIGDLDNLEQLRDMHESSLEYTQSELDDLEEDCRADIAQKQGEIGKLIQLRQLELEVAGIENGRDCVVSEWTFGPCSQTCREEGGGSGSREATRMLLTSPDKSGMACPPLKMTVSCGSDPCPRDCEMGDWGAWSPCPVECGGSTRSRSREVLSKAKNGGATCPVNEEREACGVRSCDVDCQLESWSDWSGCSKACKADQDAATGRQMRHRAVAEPAVGLGTCPGSRSRERMEVRTCNDMACPAEGSCNGKQDVVILLQGSDGANFSAQLTLARNLVGNTSEEVRFGVIAYGSAPKVLASLEQDRDALLSALDESSATAPGGAPDLPEGVMSVRSMLRNYGKLSYNKVVLVLSDGMPEKFSRSRTALDDLEAGGVRPVLGLADGYFGDSRQRACQLVGEPCAAFVEATRGWAEMAANTVRFLAAICSSPLVGNSSDSNSTGDSSA